MSQILREQFVELHSMNILERFKREIETNEAYFVDGKPLELPELPPTGKLKLKSVLKSRYFFS